MTEHRHPAALCWHCGRLLDAATELEGQHAPRPGDVSLCLYCGAVAFVTELGLRPGTKAELEELEADRDFRQSYTRFAWARQFVMLEHHLLGYDVETGGPEGTPPPP